MQQRVGLQERPFRVYKFVTMRRATHAPDGTELTEQERITRLGHVLRKTKLNELPQLFNILKGDMSFVGPWPLTLQSFYWYPKHIIPILKSVKPGLTGFGSIVFRDEEGLMSNTRMQDPLDYYRDVILPYKGRLEVYYIRRAGLWLDLLVVALTVRVLFKPKSRCIHRLFKDLPSNDTQLTHDEQGQLTEADVLEVSLIEEEYQVDAPLH